MRILFIGTVEFSRHCLEAVLRSGGKVAAVLTLAQERAGFHADYADLEPVAARQGIPVHRIEDVNAAQTAALIRSHKPDVIFVFGWSRLVSKEILAIPRLGGIAVHPTLLPRGRGRHPLIWALAEGLTESGLTFFYMNEQADSGDILWQRAFPIELRDDAGTLYRKIQDLAEAGIAEFLPQLAAGTGPRRPQDERLATYRRKRGIKDGEIVWSAASMRTYNLIRALTRPYVGAHTYLGERMVKIWHGDLKDEPLSEPAQRAEPGTVVDRTQAALRVRTGDGALWLTEWEPLTDTKVEIGMRLGAAS